MRVESSLVCSTEAGAVVRAIAAAQPDREAVVHVRDPLTENGFAAWTYRTLDQNARAIAACLQRRYPAGSRMLLLYPVGLPAVGAYFACLYAGMVAVFAPLPGRTRLERERVKVVADSARVRAVLTESESTAAVTEWLGEADLGPVGVLVTDRLPAEPHEWSPPPLDQRSLAVLQYSSGSTAIPKGVMITHGNILHTVADCVDLLGMTSATRFGGWCPLYHDMGLMGQLAPLFLGGAAILMRPTVFVKRPHLWLAMLDRFDADVSCAPNFAYELCLRRITDEQVRNLDLSRWRVAINASEPVQARTMRAFQERFAGAGLRETAMAVCYGMAEVTVLATGTCPRGLTIRRVDADALSHNEFVSVPADRGGRELVGCGTPAGLDIRIVDPETLTVLPDGRIGEVLLRGPSVARGYWRNDEATRRAFGLSVSDGSAGYVRSGDLGVLHDGQLYITGRIKEMMIVHGRNLYPQDIEHELRLRHPELAGTVGGVFAVDSEDRTDGAVAVVHELRGRFSDAELRTLSAGMIETISREFGARTAAVVLTRPGGVPRTTSGKIQRVALQQAFHTGQLDPVYATGTVGR